MESYSEVFHEYSVLCHRLAWTKLHYGETGASMGAPVNTASPLLQTLPTGLPSLYRQLNATKNEAEYNRIQERIRTIQDERDAQVALLKSEIAEVIKRLLQEPYVLERVTDLKAYEYSLTMALVRSEAEFKCH
jgi:hypothetical protein